MKKIYLFLFSLFICNILAAQDQDYKIVRDISYTQSKNPYAVERCKLDLYYPENAKDFPTVVWFHGGGLSGGSKFIPEELKNRGLAVIAVNYRLLPKATLSDCIDDAAAAVAWTFSEKELADYIDRRIADFDATEDLNLQGILSIGLII